MIAAAMTRSIAMLMELATHVMFWIGVVRDTGLRGAQLSLRIDRAGRAIANTYEHIDAEVRQHEEQLRWLREELDKARREYSEAYAELRDLYASARPHHH